MSEPDTVAFAGERFEVADRIGLMPLMRFAKFAQRGVDSNEMEGLAAMYDLLEQCIAPDDWRRFEDHADKQRVDGEELMSVVRDVIELLSSRPTRRPSDSSDGPLIMSENSADDSSQQVIDQLERRGRPDLALHVARAREFRASAAVDVCDVRGARGAGGACGADGAGCGVHVARGGREGPGGGHRRGGPRLLRRGAAG